MRNFKLFLLVCAIFILGATITFMAYSIYSVIEIRSLNISLEIVEEANIGLSGDTDKLDFGTLPNTATMEKAARIDNYRKNPVKVLVFVTGNVSPFIEVSENNFILKGNESRAVKLIARPVDAGLGYYSGQAVFYFKRV